MVVSSLAGKPADPSILIDIYKLVTGARLPLVIIHLIRNTFRLTSRRYWDELKRDVKPIYTADCPVKIEEPVSPS